MTIADPDPGTTSDSADPDPTRRRLLGAALMGGTGAATAVLAGTQPEVEKRRIRISQATSQAASSLATEWAMMFDLSVRIPAGRLNDWNRFWGGQNVPALEENGQWLWGAWIGITGQQNTITHQWAYRDLAHYQAMSKMRASNPKIRALVPQGVPIEENLISSVMTTLPYHPSKATESPAGEDTIIVTHRIFPQGAGNGAEHARLSAEYVAAASMHGAVLLGAFQSFFGWTPSYVLQVWRYRSMEHYWTCRRAIEGDAQCQRLLVQLRAIYPHETVDLHRPTPYSRLR